MPSSVDNLHLHWYRKYRDQLFACAYKMLGEVHETEDVLQEVYLEWQKTDLSEINSIEAMLKTITIRRAIDALRRLSHRKEDYIGPWLPEPLPTSANDESLADSPYRLKEQADELSVGFMLILENMSATERAVYLMKSAFDYRYAEIANELNLSVDNCRQLYNRAKQKLRDQRKKKEVNRDQHREYLQAFQLAIETGSVDKFASFLADDVVLYSDGGGKVIAALKPIYEPDKVGRLIAGLSKKWQKRNARFEFAELNNAPALLWFDGDALQTVVALDVGDNGVETVFMTRNPDKIAHLIKNNGI